MLPIYLNGRFVSHGVTGVQRFAGEIAVSLDRLWPAAETPAPTMLVPRLPQDGAPYRALGIEAVGRMRGHAWEQLELPRYTRRGLLVNLANSGPIFAQRQLVVLHDAGVFAHPEAYSVPYRFFHRELDRMLARSGVQLATVSQFSRGEIARHLGIAPSAIEVIPEGADHILRAPPNRAVLEQHGLAPRRYVLAVGSLAAHKNLGALGALAQSLSARGLDLVIVGGLATRVFGKAAALPRPARYLGRVDDMALRALYENAACFVFPSRYEGFGIPPVEAMACGCAVVAASAAAVVEVCGEAALYADPDDPAAIAAAVGRVLDDGDLANDLRRRGREHVAPLTWDNAAAALLRLIGSLCDDGALQQVGPIDPEKSQKVSTPRRDFRASAVDIITKRLPAFLA